MDAAVSFIIILIPFIKCMLNGFFDLERMRFIGIGGIKEVGKVKMVIILRHFLLNNFRTVISCFKLQYFLFLFYLIYCSMLSVFALSINWRVSF